MASQGRSRSASSRSRNGSSRSSNGSSRSRNGSSRSRNGSTPKYDDYSVVDPKDVPDAPDVLIDVPVVKVDEIDIEVGDLRAQVAVSAEVRKLLQLSVGADVSLGKVELKIEGVEAQALLKARLNNVTAIVERVLLSLDRNPELLESVGRAVEDVGSGAGDMVGETGEAVEQIGQGAGGAVKNVGQGAGDATKQIGKGASQGVADVGKGAGQAVGQVGLGAGQAVQGVGKGASRGVKGVGKGAKQGTQKLSGNGGG